MSVQVLEGMMLICFGASWPFAIIKSWRSRSVEGKSLLFLVLIIIGYVSGICTYIWREFSPVVLLYGLNASMVAMDLCLVLHFRRFPRKPSPAEPAECELVCVPSGSK